MPALDALTLSLTVDYALDFYVKGPMVQQTIQDKPLLRFLERGKKTFPGGKENVSVPVKGNNMANTSGFFAGVTDNSTLAFTETTIGDRAVYPWKVVHSGLVLSHMDLLRDGITVTDNGGSASTSDHSGVDATRLTGFMKDAIEDFGEAWARKKNEMLWRDGSQDSNQVAGVTSIILDDPTTGTVGGISQSGSSANSTSWRSRVNLALSASAENQTLTKFLRNEKIQLRRYGGRPNKALCGALFWDALLTEVQAKGTYTQTGFAGKNTDVDITTISIDGITFEYDPTLDDLGMSKRCYLFDSRRLTLMPIEGEDNKTLKPARPYQYLVLLKSMTWAGALCSSQLNAMGVYGIA